MAMINCIDENFKQFKKNEGLLKRILELNNVLQGKCYYAVFGGFAVDGYYGQISRFHEDIDLVCWRKDVPIIRKELKKMGYKTKMFNHPQEKTLIYKLCSMDKNKTYSFQIIDKAGKTNFEISFWAHAHLKFPIKYLLVQWKKINNIEFPVVSKQMLIELKRKQTKFFRDGQKTNLEKYLFRQRKKHLKTIHDLNLLSGRKQNAK